MIFTAENNKILTKLFKIKKELGAVVKSANNPFFKSKYADLNTYLDEVEPRLEADNMMLLQPCSVDALGNNVVSSIIIDIESGQSVTSEMKLVGDNDMQKAGGGITYARRYTLGSLLSMQAEDDDGNTAVRGKASKKADAPKTQATTGASKSTTPATSSFRTPKAPVESTSGDW